MLVQSLVGILRPSASEKYFSLLGEGLLLSLRFNGFSSSFFLPLLRHFGWMNPSGVFGEHCLSSAAGRVLCAPSGRVAQPPDGFIQPKEAAGWRGGVAFL